jgi:hypothetical protein
MPRDRTSRATTLRRAYGSAVPPEKITQEAHEGNPEHLHRLARLRSGDLAQVSDLWEYMQDLLYTDIQAPHGNSVGTCTSTVGRTRTLAS